MKPLELTSPEKGTSQGGSRGWAHLTLTKSLTVQKHILPTFFNVGPEPSWRGRTQGLDRKHKPKRGCRSGKGKRCVPGSTTGRDMALPGDALSTAVEPPGDALSTAVAAAISRTHVLTSPGSDYLVFSRNRIPQRGVDPATAVVADEVTEGEGVWTLLSPATRTPSPGLQTHLLWTNPPSGVWTHLPGAQRPSSQTCEPTSCAPPPPQQTHGSASSRHRLGA